jgi:hypothetical protein
MRIDTIFHHRDHINDNPYVNINNIRNDERCVGLKAMQENLRKCDVVLEIHDARV